MQPGQDSDYEQSARAEIEAWKRRGPSMLNKTTGFVLSPLNKPIARLADQELIRKAIARALDIAVDVGKWAIPDEAALTRFREHGFDVADRSSIPTAVPLDHIDSVMRSARMRNIGLGAAEGTAAGWAALAAAGTGAAAAPASG